MAQWLNKLRAWAAAKVAPKKTSIPEEKEDSNSALDDRVHAVVGAETHVSNPYQDHHHSPVVRFLIDKVYEGKAYESLYVLITASISLAGVATIIYAFSDLLGVLYVNVKSQIYGCQIKETDKIDIALILHFSDKLLIALTLLFMGKILFSALMDVPTSPETGQPSIKDDCGTIKQSVNATKAAMEHVDIVILKMIAITLAVLFLTKAIDDEPISKITYEYGIPMGFMFLCITIYIYISENHTNRSGSPELNAPEPNTPEP